MIERKTTAALQLDTAHVRLPNDLIDRIKREAAKPQKPAWWASWMRRKGVQVAAAALLVLPLAGFAAKQIWVVPAKQVKPGEVLQRTPTKEVPVNELSTSLDFPLRLPQYLPDGMTLFASVLAGDSSKPDARLRVVSVSWLKQGVGGITIQEWRANEAAAFPPGDSNGEVLDTEPWHKTLKNAPAKVGEIQGSLLTYLLSGNQVNRVYWHENGINYAVSADGQLPVEELLKVAGSVR